MTNEKISHVCVVCGKRLPNLTAYELKVMGFALDCGEGHFLYMCGGKKHTMEEVVKAAANPPEFHRASECER